MKVSGNTSSLILSAPASSISCTVFLMVAALSMKTGAAWAAATLNFVSFGAIVVEQTVPSLWLTRKSRTFVEEGAYLWEYE
jgi:hypothetical protein